MESNFAVNVICLQHPYLLIRIKRRGDFDMSWGRGRVSIVFLFSYVVFQNGQGNVLYFSAWWGDMCRLAEVLKGVTIMLIHFLLDSALCIFWNGKIWCIYVSEFSQIDENYHEYKLRIQNWPKLSNSTVSMGKPLVDFSLLCGIIFFSLIPPPQFKK